VFAEERVEIILLEEVPLTDLPRSKIPLADPATDRLRVFARPSGGLRHGDGHPLFHTTTRMTKVMNMGEAISRFVPDGSSIALGCALEPAIPFSAGHELIRRRRRDLTLIGPISDILFDQLIGAGCVAKVVAAWVGNVSAGLAHCYRRATEQGIPRRIEIEDHSNFSIGLSLLAGALGAPYIPTRSLLGSDLRTTNPTFREATDPFSGEKILLVPAIRPDVTILAVQRADADGNAQLEGPWGVCEEAALAAERVVVVADELVDGAVIGNDPNATIVPAPKTSAVVVEPGAAHPSPLQGRYGRDHEFFHDYHRATRTPEGFEAWLSEWVLGVGDRATYLRKLGARWERLRLT
jgi:glutaconate CoA-transferase subunit A